jgi:DWNN domain
VNFVGNGIKVLELKREILERKKFSGSSDFDLKIVDESGKGSEVAASVTYI